jgi:hypothetical protein
LHFNPANPLAKAVKAALIRTGKGGQKKQRGAADALFIESSHAAPKNKRIAELERTTSFEDLSQLSSPPKRGPEDSKKLCAEMLQRNPQDAFVHFQYAGFLQGEFKLKHLLLGHRYDPKSQPILAALLHYELEEQKPLQKAKVYDYITKLLKLDMTHFCAWLGLVKLEPLMEKAELDAFIEEFKKVFEPLKKNNLGSLFFLVSQSKKKGRINPSLMSSAKAKLVSTDLTKVADLEVLFPLADLLVKIEEPELARQAYQRILILDPGNTKAAKCLETIFTPIKI